MGKAQKPIGNSLEEKKRKKPSRATKDFLRASLVFLGKVLEGGPMWPELTWPEGWPGNFYLSRFA